MSSIPFLDFENITLKNFPEKIIKKFNLTISKGENWAFAGNNLFAYYLLQAIFNNMNLLNGEIRYHFYNDYIHKHPSDDPLFNYKSLIALVPQKHHFKNRSNTSEFYYQQRYNAHDAEDAETVKEYLAAVQTSDLNLNWTVEKIIEVFDLEPLLDEHVIKLSNGETRRLLIAAALLKAPSLLLLDQPFTGLDVATRKKLDQIITRIIQSEITVIISTSAHEVPEAISHVAVVNEELEFQTFSKASFDHKILHESLKVKIPATELFSLISSSPFPDFNIIAAFDNAVVRYDEKLILDHVTWEIKQGERWAISGPNGAGKTTLLSLIYADHPQSYANKIVLFDKKRGSGESIWEIKKRIGFMSPELYQYFPSSFSCIKVVESGFYDSAGLYKKSEKQNAAKALNWMQMFGIANYSERYFYEIPVNVQRLCLLARAMVKNPPLLLLDEPCQNLNEYEKEHFKSLINTICEFQKTTVLYVSHYSEEIPSCVTKILKLKNGKVEYLGNR